MAAKRQRGPNRKPVLDSVINDMKELGVYSPAYADAINIYVDLLLQYKVLTAQWEASGYAVTEEYTNKAGAVNDRKVPIVTVIEKLRSDIGNYSDRLMINPKSLTKGTVKPEPKKSHIGQLIALPSHTGQAGQGRGS